MAENVRENPVAVWVHSLRPWQDFATMTFRPAHRDGRVIGTGQYAATLHWRDLMDTTARGTSWFAAFEPNPGIAGYHIHALLCGLQVRRDALWHEWFGKHGRATIEPILSKGDVVSYCAKYVTKDPRTWWDFRLYPERPRLAA